MDIRLKDIDLIRERTQVSYKKAKEALEKANGNIVDALILLEEDKTTFADTLTVKGSETIEKIKEIIKKGNVTKIRVKHGDKVIMDIPVTAGAIGSIIIPQLTLLGATVALIADCTIEIERPTNSKSVENTTDTGCNTNDADDI